MQRDCEQGTTVPFDEKLLEMLDKAARDVNRHYPEGSDNPAAAIRTVRVGVANGLGLMAVCNTVDQKQVDALASKVAMLERRGEVLEEECRRAFSAGQAARQGQNDEAIAEQAAEIERLEAEIAGWKAWHRQVSDAVGARFCEREVTLATSKRLRAAVALADELEIGARDALQWMKEHRAAEPIGYVYDDLRQALARYEAGRKP